MHFLELPPEVLSTIISYASTSPTRQKRRLALLQIGRTCKAVSAHSLRLIYTKLAYEISQKGLKLLNVFETSLETGRYRYSGFVRALAIREREGAPQRRVINSRDEHSVTAPTIPTRLRKSVFEAVKLEEARLATLLAFVQDNLAELKYETNLFPLDPTTFSKLRNLQSLSIVADPPYPDSADRTVRLNCATFTLNLPPDSFIPAFGAYVHLTQLDLWKCSFRELEEHIDQQNRPSFRLYSLTLQECDVSGATLRWLTSSTVEATSLRTLKLGFLVAYSDIQDGQMGLRDAVTELIKSAGNHLIEFAFEGDEHALRAPAAITDEPATGVVTAGVKSPFTALKSLRRLKLGGVAIEDQDWLAIPDSSLSQLQCLEICYTPQLPPELLVTSLRAMPSSVSTQRGRVTINAAQGLRRANISELRQAGNAARPLWNWSREEYMLLVSLMSSKNISLTVDRPISHGAVDEASSDDEDFELGGVDEAGDFYVTAEQWEQEKQIEQEELARTWESGSEY